MVTVAKFKTMPALTAGRPGHSSARLGQKESRYGRDRKWDPFHQIIIQ